MLTVGVQGPNDVDPAGVAGDADRVGALRAVDDDRVGRAVAVAAGPRRSSSTAVTSVPVRSLTVMLSAPPSA